MKYERVKEKFSNDGKTGKRWGKEEEQVLEKTEEKVAMGGKKER